jgi:hypothetical protein
MKTTPKFSLNLSKEEARLAFEANRKEVDELSNLRIEILSNCEKDAVHLLERIEKLFSLPARTLLDAERDERSDVRLNYHNVTQYAIDKCEEIMATIRVLENR